MNNIISIKNLTKQFGDFKAIEDLTLEIPDGVIFGFLGPNGAGKTTTISMLVNLTKPSHGSISIFNKDSTEYGREIRKNIGFLSSDMALDGSLTGQQQIEYFGHLKGSYDKEFVDELAKRLNCNLNKKIKTLSRGNRQKVGLISALMHKPKLLILDEPTSGLDPLIQSEFNKIILEHKKEGGSAFISSHVLSEIQELCDHVAFIKEGKLVANTTIEKLASDSPKYVSITTKAKPISKAIESLKTVRNFKRDGDNISFNVDGDINDLIKIISKYKIINLSIEDADLESIFMQFYQEKDKS